MGVKSRGNIRLLTGVAFREIRKEGPNRILRLVQDLFERLETDVEAATKIVEAPLYITQMDAKLVNLLEARNAIQERWCKQRLNRRLREETAELHPDIEEHALTLNNQKWDEICTLTDGRIRMA
ncbi:hypothetical protein HPB48_021714 [Haemaphysalis longicornis]|uniref:Uncharacterized protein n=1 Tax=Haemaphysalis longicornis TaxID=44386 RepID=A0A9J6FQ34_HAELO|nr:hypothetical protein HPB48_021714 [Haemaphysalis longicornis]